MRFVHIADTHLGLGAFGKLDPDSGMNLRERLIYENFLETVEVIIRQKPEAIVHAGDLFDRVKPKTRAYTTVLEALERFRDTQIPIIVISGNHSMPKTRYTPSPFEVLEYHAAELHAAYRYRYERVEVGDAVFHCIPNMLHAEDYMTAFGDIDLSGSMPNILVTHGLAAMLHDSRLKTVAEHELNATILSPDFDYIALGHYHSQRQVADNAWYSGSLEFCNYGEIFDTKGGLIVDTDRGDVQHLDLPHAPMIHLGTIQCDHLSPRELNTSIESAISNINGASEQGMYLLVLENAAKDAVHGINRQFLTQVKSRVLDLRLKVIPAEEQTPDFGGKDLKAVDYVSEFANFLSRKSLDPSVQEYILAKGREVLKKAMERHQEASDETR